MTPTSPYLPYPQHQLDAAGAQSSIEPHAGGAHLDQRLGGWDRGKPSRSHADEFSRGSVLSQVTWALDSKAMISRSQPSYLSARLARQTMLRWMDSGNRVPSHNGSPNKEIAALVPSFPGEDPEEQQAAASPATGTCPQTQGRAHRHLSSARSRPGWPGPASLHRLWPVIVI